MRKFFLILLAAMAMSSAGCWSVPFWHSAKSVDAAKPMAAAIVNTDEAFVKAENARRERDGKLKANIQAARKENATQPPANATTVVEGELGTAEARLADTPSDPAEQAAAAERKTLVEAGKASAAQQAYISAAKEAADNAKQVGVAEEQVKAARQHEKDEHAAYEKRIEDDAAVTAKKFKEQQDGILHEQAKWLSIAAAGCLAIFLLGAGFGQLAGLKIVWPFSVYAVVLFGLAQIVSQSWFAWAVGGAIVVGGIITGVWVRRHYLQGDLLQATKDKAAKWNAVVKPTVEVLDKAYDSAELPIKNWLDEHVFNILSSKMDATAKSAVHEVRAGT